MPNSPIFLPEKVKEAAYSWGLGWAESLCQIHGTKESKYYGMNDHNSGEKKNGYKKLERNSPKCEQWLYLKGET